MTAKQYAKKIVSIFLVFCLVAGSLFAVKPQEAYAGQSNLLANGGFDTTADWYNSSGDTDVAIPEQQQVKDVEVTEHFVNGDFENTEYDYSITWWTDTNNSLTWKVADEGNGNRVLYASNIAAGECLYAGVQLEAGKTYTISFDIKTSTTANDRHYHLFNSAWAVLKDWKKITTNWEMHTYEYTPASTESVLIFQNPNAGDLYIDNFSVTTEKAKMTKTELIPNGDFESTEYDYTQTWWSQSSLNFGVEAEEGRGRVLHVQDFNGTKCMDVKVPLKAGTTYTVSLDVKSVTTSWVSYHLYDAGWSTLLKDWVAIPNTWTTYTYTYTPKTDQTGFVFQSCEGGSGDFYIDNFSVTTEKESVTVADIVPNGDFENTEYDYNEVWWSQSNLNFGVETEEGRGRVLHVQDFNGTKCVDVKLPLKAGQSYTVSLDVKSATTSWVSYHLYDAGWSTLLKDWVAIPNTWTTYTYSYTPKTDQTGFVFQSCEGGSGDFYIDNFSVTTEVEAVTYTEGIGTCLGVESDNVLAMKEMTEATYKNVSLTAGKQYEYSYQVKTDGAASVSLAAGVQSVQTTAATSEWSTISGSFTAEADATEISFRRSGEGSLLIDDVVISEVVAPEATEVKTTLSKVGLFMEEGATEYTMHLGVSNYADLIAEYGEWSWFEGEILIDGTPTKLRFNLGSNLFATFKSIPSDVTSVVIPVGTEFKDEDGSSTKLLVTETELKIDNGAPEATEVKTILSKVALFMEEGATAYTMHLGVSNYADLIAEYGEWSWFEGEILIDGTPTKLRFNLGSNLFATFKSIPSDVTSVVIPAGTEFKDEDGSSTKLLVTETELRIENGAPEATEVKTTLSENSFSETDEAYRLVVNVSNYDNLIEEFGIWSWFEGEILVDGAPTTVRFNLGAETAPFTCFYHEQNQTAIIPLSASSIVIPQGTEFKDVDNSSNALLVTENEFSLSIRKPEPDVFNDIKISFDSINGEAGFYFKAEIVDGPDKGKVIGTEAYGEWMSPSFGTAFYCLDGQMTEIEISYSPINDKIYLSGFPTLSTLDGITLKEGTIIRPVGTAQNVTPMRIVNTVEMEQDKVYGRWGYKGQIQTPTEFYDVVASVEKIGPYALTLVVEFADGSKKTLSEIYGENAALSGATEIVDPEQGTYTNKETQYLIQPDGKMLLCVDFAMPDSVEVKSGTILWPSINSEIQKPVRILNRIYLDRDAEDEWVIRVGAVGDAPVIDGNVTEDDKPKTGDEAPIVVYASFLIVAIAVVCVCGYLQKKRRQQV